jgi:hypothetical protein
VNRDTRRAVLLQTGQSALVRSLLGSVTGTMRRQTRYQRSRLAGDGWWRCPAARCDCANGSWTTVAFIMSGVNFPKTGCWEVKGKFKGLKSNSSFWLNSHCSRDG